MRALVVTGPSKIEDLSFQETNVPAIGSSQVLVKVKAAGINPVDFMPPVLGAFAPFGLTTPYIMGIDFAGEIVETGADITAYNTGDAVLGAMALNKPGAFAEYLVVDAANIVHKPTGLSFVEAAAIPLVSQTAVEALEEHLQLQAGQKILIQAAAGGVGTFAVQLAKQKGAYVVAVGSRPNADFLKDLGADEVIDYKDGFDKVPADFDAILDSKASAAQTIPLLRKNGRYVSLTLPAPAELVEEYGVIASSFLFTAGTDRLNRIVRNDGLKIIIDKVFPAAEIAQALAYQSAGRSKGKNVLAF